MSLKTCESFAQKPVTLPLPPIAEVDKELAERYFDSYIRQAWHVIEPATTYKHNWHIDYIAEHLQLVADGRLPRLIINIPPRYMKSIQVSVMWPTWLWTRYPHVRFLCGSYSQLLAVKHSVDRRNVVQSAWYQGNWGDKVKLMPDQNMKQEFLNTQYGHMIATSVGGSTTGKGGDIILLDDPMDPSRALSKTERESTNRWIDQTLSTRLNNKESGAIVLVMQRLHVEDATGHLMKQVDEISGQRDWKALSIPSETEEDRVYTFPISGRTHIHKAGESLFPERESTEVLRKQKRAMGLWAYTGQYLQRPTPLSGGIFKRDDFQRYDVKPLTEFMHIAISVDATFKKTSDGSYVCMDVWGAWGANRYLLEQVRERLSFTETIAALRALRSRWPTAIAVLIEDKANGPAIIDVLKDEIPGLLPISASTSKEERAASVSPQVEAHNVWIPQDKWVDEWIEEVCSFPAAAQNDRVDTMSQALWWLLPYGASRQTYQPEFHSPSVAAALDW